MRIITLPGVFQPRSDTWLLANELREQILPPRAAVLDLCTGSGALAVCAAQRGAREVHAVDISRRAVWTARINGRLNGVRVRAHRGDLFAPVGRKRFDGIVSNPPYVPGFGPDLPTHGPERAWDAGLDGRLLLDRICAGAPEHLRPGGFVLIVHSSVCGERATIDALRAGGLDTEVVARRRGPLGPLLSGRVSALVSRGLLHGGADEEELVVIRGRKPVGTADAAWPHAGDLATA